MAVGVGQVTAPGPRAGTKGASAAARGAPGRPAARRGGWPARLESPLAAYYLVLGSGVALVVIGLIMVLSSSSVESLRETKLHSSYTFFTKQALFAGIGTPLAWIASRIPPAGWKRLSWVMLAGALGLLLLVPFIGVEINGNRNWI